MNAWDRVLMPVLKVVGVVLFLVVAAHNNHQYTVQEQVAVHSTALRHK